METGEVPEAHTQTRVRAKLRERPAGKGSSMGRGWRRGEIGMMGIHMSIHRPFASSFQLPRWIKEGKEGNGGLAKRTDFTITK